MIYMKQIILFIKSMHPFSEKHAPSLRKGCTLFQMLSILFCWVGLFFQSCSDITEMQREYLDRGEKLYVGKIDSIQMRGGLNRIQMEGLLRYTRTAVRCEISWADQTREYLIDDIRQGDTARVMIDGLQEGTYRFTVQTFDTEGNQSLKDEYFGYAYGEQYKMSQTKKFISEMKPEPSKMILVWNLSDDAIFVDVSYEVTDGKIKKLILPGDVAQTDLADWKKGGKIESVTYTLPEKNAVDTIRLDPVVQYFPTEVEYEVNKSNFRAVPLPTDSKGNGYDGKIEGIWDGVEGSEASNRYHSSDGEGVPHHLTFDMGVYATLSRFTIAGRAGYANWNPKRFQLWGIDSLDGAETTLPSSDAGWENEAVSKGWKLLIDATNKDTDKNSYILDKSKTNNIRYIRYRVLDVFGPPSNGSGAYGCVQEMSFWADDMKQINK